MWDTALHTDRHLAVSLFDKLRAEPWYIRSIVTVRSPILADDGRYPLPVSFDCSPDCVFGLSSALLQRSRDTTFAVYGYFKNTQIGRSFEYTKHLLNLNANNLLLCFLKNF